MEKKKRGVAPTEVGELPTEKRCKRCMRTLSVYEQSEKDRFWWCNSCGIMYGKFGGEDN